MSLSPDTSPAAEPQQRARVLLIGQGPDGHPFLTHEYRAAASILANLLKRHPGVQPIVTIADDDWTDGPELLDSADAAVVFVSEGAKWLQASKPRLAAFQALASRGGGLICLHWGMGTKDAENIAEWVKLFGGCHGGPDRRYKVVDVAFEVRCLRVHFRVGRNFDVEVIAGFLADECHQFVGVAEFAEVA